MNVLSCAVSKNGATNAHLFVAGMRVSFRKDIVSAPYAERVIESVAERSKEMTFVGGVPHQLERGDLICFEGDK